jgi:hypothetical protein
MERFISRRSLIWATWGLSLGLLALTTVGCKGLSSTVAYLIKGTDVDADYDGLRNKRVVVVVRNASGAATTDAEYGAQELARQIGDNLQANVSGLKTIDQQEVDRWKDDLNHHEQDDFRALGKSLKADAVVAVELEEFRLNDNSTSLYTGRSDFRLVVFDLKDKKGDIVYSYSPKESIVYPPNHGVPIGNKTRAQFRKIFVSALAEKIAEHFYAHDPTVHFASDSELLEYH